MRTAKLLLLALALALAASPRAALADAGVVLFSAKGEHETIFVLAHNVPLRAGPNTLSVCVRENESGQPILDAAVDLTLTPSAAPGMEWKAPCSHCVGPAGAAGTTLSAQRGEFGNLLLYDVSAVLPTAGPWQFSVRAQLPGGGSATASGVVTVEPPVDPWRDHALALLGAPLVLGLLAAHQFRSGVKKNASR